MLSAAPGRSPLSQSSSVVSGTEVGLGCTGAGVGFGSVSSIGGGGVAIFSVWGGVVSAAGGVSSGVTWLSQSFGAGDSGIGCVAGGGVSGVAGAGTSGVLLSSLSQSLGAGVSGTGAPMVGGFAVTGAAEGTGTGAGEGVGSAATGAGGETGVGAGATAAESSTDRIAGAGGPE